MLLDFHSWGAWWDYLSLVLFCFGFLACPALFCLAAMWPTLRFPFESALPPCAWHCCRGRSLRICPPSLSSPRTAWYTHGSIFFAPALSCLVFARLVLSCLASFCLVAICSRSKLADVSALPPLATQGMVHAWSSLLVFWPHLVLSCLGLPCIVSSCLAFSCGNVVGVEVCAYVRPPFLRLALWSRSTFADMCALRPLATHGIVHAGFSFLVLLCFVSSWLV